VGIDRIQKVHLMIPRRSRIRKLQNNTTRIQKLQISSNTHCKTKEKEKMSSTKLERVSTSPCQRVSITIRSMMISDRNM
jgi:hypothetical protein